MNNYCCACGAYLKALPQPFTIFKLPASLSLCTILFIHCQSHHHLHSALLLAPHRPQFKIHRQRRSPQLFIINFSSFILTHHRQPHHHRHSSLSLAPAPPQFKIHRQRRSPQLFIIHFSSFIFTHRRQPRTITRPALPPFFIFHLSKHHPLPSLRPSYQLLSLTF